MVINLDFRYLKNDEKVEYFIIEKKTSALPNYSNYQSYILFKLIFTAIIQFLNLLTYYKLYIIYMVLAFIDPIFQILRHFITSIKTLILQYFFSVILRQLTILAMRNVGTFLKLIKSFQKKK